MFGAPEKSSPPPRSGIIYAAFATPILTDLTSHFVLLMSQQILPSLLLYPPGKEIRLNIHKRELSSRTYEEDTKFVPFSSFFFCVFAPLFVAHEFNSLFYFILFSSVLTHKKEATTSREFVFFGFDPNISDANRDFSISAAERHPSPQCLLRYFFSALQALI